MNDIHQNSYNYSLMLFGILVLFPDKLTGVEGARLLQDRWAGETLKSETYKCGSPPAPRKASTWNANQLLT
ncbi:hypothetical protein ABE65_002410 [Fictibacillus phosphorivorans]|uniref:Uncharacterized protein n=1 Tax=Fictibacillus phosphorivorans TaxID=1221500 RepID=A0A160IIZ8_9BACL|nr:hypothetical protein ABE65_002410 [Fictibacillus phosphorivorans]